MNLLPAIFCTLGAALAAPLLLALLRRSRRLRPRYGGCVEPAERSRGLEYFTATASLLLTLLISYPLWAALRAAYELQLATPAPAVFVVALPESAWFVPAFLFALFPAALALRALLVWLLGARRYAEYVARSDRDSGVDSWKLFRWLALVVLPLCGLLTLMALDSYTRFDEREIVINRFFGFGEQHYELRQLAAIELVPAAPAGGAGWPHYVLHFSDGEHYDFLRSAQDLDFYRQRAIVEYLRAATGIEVDTGTDTGAASPA